MGSFFQFSLFTLVSLQSWVNGSKTTPANAGSDQSCTSMSATMRLSICLLFHIQFLCSFMDVNPECRFWFGIIVDIESPWTFLSLLMCSWWCVNDHPLSCLLRQLKPSHIPREAWRVLQPRHDQILRWISGNVVFSQHTLTTHIHTLSTGRFFCLISDEYDSLCTRLWTKTIHRVLVALTLQEKSCLDYGLWIFVLCQKS